MNNLKTLLGFGNTKLPKTIAIFNMTSSTDCPSRKLGQCKVCQSCYAFKAERLYPSVLPFRTRQSLYWLNNSGEKILADMLEILSTKRTKITLFRYNEAGDFSTQEDIQKLDIIAKGLLKIGIKTYGYSARTDLDFSNVSFLVKSSGNQNNTVNNGYTIVLEKKDPIPENVKLCKMSCKICSMCSSSKKINIAFRKH